MLVTGAYLVHSIQRFQTIAFPVTSYFMTPPLIVTSLATSSHHSVQLLSEDVGINWRDGALTTARHSLISRGEPQEATGKKCW